VTAPSDGEAKTVVVDVSHGNALGENDLQPFVDALVAAGHEVRFYAGGQSGVVRPTQGGSPFNETLRSADALVVASPGHGLHRRPDSRCGGVRRRRRSCAAGRGPADHRWGPADRLDTRPDRRVVGVGGGQPATLAARFDVTFGAGYLYDMAENANNFQRVYAGGDVGVAEGVEAAVLLEATPLRTGPDATPVLTAESVSLSTTRSRARLRSPRGTATCSRSVTPTCSRRASSPTATTTYS